MNMEWNPNGIFSTPPKAKNAKKFPFVKEKRTFVKIMEKKCSEICTVHFLEIILPPVFIQIIIYNQKNLINEKI